MFGKSKSADGKVSSWPNIQILWAHVDKKPFTDTMLN